MTDGTQPAGRSDPEIGRMLGLGRKRSGVRRLVAVVVCLALAGAGLGIYWALEVRGARGKVQYETAPARRADIRATVTATGRLKGLNTVDVGAEVSGRLVGLYVDYNTRVKKGDLLAEIDPEQLTAAVDEAEAQLASSEASILQAKATVLETGQVFDRAKQQSAHGLVSQRELEAAEAGATRAVANLAAAKASATLARAALISARSRLKKTKILAPMDGVVLTRYVERGQTVTAGFQTPLLFTLAEDLTRLALYIDVDEADIGRVREGQQAVFSVDAYPDRSFPSRLVTLRNQPKISQNVVTYEAILSVDNTAGLLRPGMTTTANIITDVVKGALVVPNAALRYSPPETRGPFSQEANQATEVRPKGEQRVWVLEGGSPRQLYIRTGVTDGLVTEVRGGDVKEGMQVVVNSTEEQ